VMFEEREKRESLTFESEENEESEFIFLLLRVVDLTEETEVIVTPESVPILRHDVGEGVGDISRLDDRSSFSRFPQEEEEREDDTSEEDPFSDLHFLNVSLCSLGEREEGENLRRMELRERYLTLHLLEQLQIVRLMQPIDLMREERRVCRYRRRRLRSI